MQTILDVLRRLGVARAIAAGVTLVIAAGVTISIVDNGPDHPPGVPRRTVTVTLGGPGHEKVPLTPAAQQVAAQQAKEDAAGQDARAESDLHEDKLPSRAVEKKAEAMTPVGQPEIPAHVPLAAASEPGCRTALVRNFSSRHGAPVLFFFLHWTGSRSFPGSWSDVLGNVRWFDTPASQASSNFITDDDGHCALAVSVSQKAWTQANSNPWAVSDEHVNPGAGPLFVGSKGRATVVRLMRSMHRDFKLPYQHGIVHQGRNGTCIPVRPGYLAHRDGGACSGGHPDVGDFDLDGLIREAAAGDCSAACRVRRDHARVHKAIRDHRCSPEARSRSVNCKTLYARNHAQHARARQLHVAL